uniref:Uncharacterized protein n=1 Tax=Rhizophora mucronata TaxID=61149 RepID=A0A2P2QVB5_RHIMU
MSEFVLDDLRLFILLLVLLLCCGLSSFGLVGYLE